jgi:hypothetical protein
LWPKHLLFCSKGLQLSAEPFLKKRQQYSPGSPFPHPVCVVFACCRDLQPKHLLFCSEGMAWKLIDFSTTVTANVMVVPEVGFSG